MKLDEKIWRTNAIPLSDAQLERWYDGSFPTLRAMMQLSDEELQSNFLDEIKENRKKGIEEKEVYWAGDAVLYRNEMGRRINQGLVRFDKIGKRAGEPHKLPKGKLVEVYNRYVSIYEQKRIEIGNKKGTGYSADKQAIEETVKEIKKLEGIDVKPRNLKEALTRRVERRPLKKEKE